MRGSGKFEFPDQFESETVKTVKVPRVLKEILLTTVCLGDCPLPTAGRESGDGGLSGSGWSPGVGTHQGGKNHP
jgi:hypothetical protein